MYVNVFWGPDSNVLCIWLKSFLSKNTDFTFAILDMALWHPSPARPVWWLYVLFSLHCKNLSDPMCRTKLRLSLLCFLLRMGMVFASQNSLLAGHLLEISLSLNGLHLRNMVTMSELHAPSLALLSIPFRLACSLKASVNYPNPDDSSVSLSLGLRYLSLYPGKD